MACFNTRYRKYLNPDNPAGDVDVMLSAYLNYPGSPRFQQLSAIVNALVNGSSESVDDPSEMKVDKSLQLKYSEVIYHYLNLCYRF